MIKSRIHTSLKCRIRNFDRGCFILTKPYAFDVEDLKKRDFKINSLGVPYKKIPEKEATIEFKFRSWTGSANIFDGKQTIILDIPVGQNTRIRFDRTHDKFRFIRVRYDKNRIDQLEFHVNGTKESPLSRFHQYHVFLIWSKRELGFAIGNTGLNNLHQIRLELEKK